MTATNHDEQARRVREDFDRKAGMWGGLYEEPRDFRHYNFITRRRTVLELMPGVDGLVLDIGCGTGDFVPHSLERSKGVLGIEVSEEMARRCRERFPDAVRDGKAIFCRGDIERLPLPDGSMGAVLCIAVIEYLLGADAALAEIARVLAPGGFTILTVPNKASPFIQADNVTKAVLRTGSRIYRAMTGRPRDDGSYMHGYFTPGGLNRRLEAAGLKVEARAFSTFGSFMYSNSIPGSIAFSEALGGLRHRALGVLATNYIVRARKPGPARG